MSVPLAVSFEGGRTATAVRVDQPSDTSAALAALGLHAPQRVVVLVGGAGHMDASDLGCVSKVGGLREMLRAWDEAT